MNADQYLIRGNEQFANNDYSNAAISFETALKLDRFLCEAHWGYGLAHYQLGNNAKVESALSKLIQLCPEWSNIAAAYAIRCMARSNLGNRKGAMSDYQQAVSRNKDMASLIQSQTCVATTQTSVLASVYPAQFAMIVAQLTRA
jgi:tetratricopeptide (TPR) repeat protein